MNTKNTSGLILFPSLAEQDEGLKCKCMLMYNVDPSSRWVQIPTLLSSCPWIPGSLFCSSWTCKLPRLQPHSSCSYWDPLCPSICPSHPLSLPPSLTSFLPPFLPPFLAPSLTPFLPRSFPPSLLSLHTYIQKWLEVGKAPVSSIQPPSLCSHHYWCTHIWVLHLDTPDPMVSSSMDYDFPCLSITSSCCGSILRDSHPHGFLDTSSTNQLIWFDLC